MNRNGRVAIFGKKNGPRVQGVLTREGGRCFNKARAALGTASGRRIQNVSDGDTIEYLARGCRVPSNAKRPDNWDE